MPELGPPLDWDEADREALSAVTPADQKAADAYSRLGNPLLRAMYDAQPEEPDGPPLG